MKTILTLLIATCLALPAAAQVPDTLRHSIPAPPVGAQGAVYLGSSVGVDGAYAVVGAPLADASVGNDGEVKVFDATTGNLLFVIPNPAPAAEGFFGDSVAISGTRVVVGAPFDNTGTNAFGSVYVYDLASGTPTVPVLTMHNPHNPGLDLFYEFGRSVAISGTIVVVGSPFEPIGTVGEAGSVYVYDLTRATPAVPLATLNRPSSTAGDHFGQSVAISGLSVVVGTDVGSAYVYDLSGGTPTVPIVALDNVSQGGLATAILGTFVVVGAPFDDTGGTNVGRVYMYDLSSATPAVPIATLNNPTPGAFVFFGFKVSMSGTRVAASGQGRVLVYDLNSGTPAVPVATLINPSPAFGDFFGGSVAIFDTRVVVGDPNDDTMAVDAGSAFLYDLGTATPSVPVATLNNPSPSGDDHFGTAVAIAGTRMVVGSREGKPGAAYAGSAYVYDLSSGMPTVPVLELNKPGPAASFDFFGGSVAMSGTRVVVGVPGDDTGESDAGSAYVYDLSSGTPTVPVATLNNPSPAVGDGFGGSVAVSGTHVVVGAGPDDSGASDAGSAYVYDLSSGTPMVPVATLNNPGPAVEEYFGTSVSISGTRVVVGVPGDSTGAPYAGSVYVYDLSNATPTIPLNTLNNPSPADGDGFGISVAISGTRVVVGARFDDTGASDAGSAYVYDLSSGTPTVPLATLNNPGPAAGDRFGGSVAISGTRVVVGANLDNTGANDAGSAYVYDLTSGTPTVPVATLNSPGPAVGDTFGSSVAIDGNTVVIGTPSDDTVVYDKGAAYVFAPANPDYDGNGLLDLWEYARFGSVGGRSALDDSDGDGRKELLEQAFDTNPLLSDPVAAPKPVDEGGFLTITISKRAGISYTVETAGSPSGADFSMGTTTIITNNASTLKVRDNFTPATAAQRFMRVKVESAP